MIKKKNNGQLMAVAVKINGSKGNYSNDGNDKGNYYK